MATNTYIPSVTIPQNWQSTIQHTGKIYGSGAGVLWGESRETVHKEARRRGIEPLFVWYERGARDKEISDNFATIQIRSYTSDDTSKWSKIIDTADATWQYISSTTAAIR